MSNHYTLTVPVEAKDGKTYFRRVGAMFPSKEDSKTAFQIKLDFPVGATEIVAFAPKDTPPEED